MKARTLIAITLAGAFVIPQFGFAQTEVVNENFDSATPGLNGPSDFGGYGNFDGLGGTGWQAQGGNGGGTMFVTAGIDNSGVGFSQGLFTSWDNTGATNYTWSQVSLYGLPAPGAGAQLSGISIAMDISVSGAVSSTPLSIAFINNDYSTEWDLSPTLVNDSFTHVEFTVDQATPNNGGAFLDTMPVHLRVQFGNSGFGFDSGNNVVLDNVVVTYAPVPEPTSLLLMGLSAAAVCLLRRRCS